MTVSGLLLLAGTGLFGCKKPAPPPPAPVERAPEPGSEYTDGMLQNEYENAWRRYFASFTPPEIGEYLWLKRRDGSIVGGEVKSWSKSSLVLKDGTNEIAIARDEMDDSALPRAFADAFARQQALAEVEDSQTLRVDKSGSSPLVGTVRYAISDTLPLRGGPGDRFERIEVAEFNRGTMLEVQEQKGLWIRVKPRGNERSFWIPQLATRPIPDAPPEDNTALIAQLLDAGLLIDYSPLQSEARVSRGVWMGTHPGIREGLSRMIATHSAQVRNANIEWIEIKDSETGRRLARYSQAQGFRSQ